jgi:uncharacterized membrane protein
MLAGLPYVVWPIGSLFILASRKKEDAFLHYHAVQGLLAGGIMVAFVLGLLLTLFVGFRVMPGSASYLPAFFGLGTLFVGGGVTLGVFLTAVFLGWRATEGEMIRIPFLGDYAEEKMLDQTGMTRREFEAMCEASLTPSPVTDEEIPFPELRDSTPVPKETAIDRLEAARQARAAQDQRRHPEPKSGAPARPHDLIQPRSPQSPSQPGVARQQPVVRDVDLIGHYRENRVDAGKEGQQKADVLRQWLSSVDNDS